MLWSSGCVWTIGRTAILLLPLLASACGGGGGGTASTPAPPAIQAPPIALPPPANRAAVVAVPNPDQRGTGEHWFSYEVTQGGTTFVDPDGDPLTYHVRFLGTELAVSGTTISGFLTSGGPLTVIVDADDGRGLVTSDTFVIRITPNASPVVAKPNLALLTAAGSQIDYDATQGDSTFTDADGDVLTYSLEMVSPPRGLSVDGTRVSGALESVGIVTFEITADDGYGASVVDRFSVAVPAADPALPTLPLASYVYDDEQLPLPPKFREASEDPGPSFFDTQPPDNRTSNAGATLGRVLFYDRRLSLTNTHSCGSCHHQVNGFAAPERFSVGVQGTPMKRNTLGLTNARYNASRGWFWDTRIHSLEELALLPIQEPTELGNFLPLLEAKLAATSFYPNLFAAAFGTPEVTSERIARALAQFLQALISYRTKFDQAFLTFDPDVDPHPSAGFTPAETRGTLIFNSNPGAFCVTCHSGDIQTAGTPKNNGLDAVITDIGAGEGRFRVGSLRNIAVTAPYMHDGRFATLREVIDHYDHGIVNSASLAPTLRDRNGEPGRLNLSEDDKLALEAFLHTLTDHEFLTDPKFADPFE